MNKAKEIHRCGWCLKDDLYVDYHDTEWGVPVWDELKMFEFLILETFQAGLSWHTILKKRENFRKAFEHFNPEKVARFSEKKILSLMENEGIIRNQAKIRGAVKNAQLFEKIVSQNNSFCEYIWQFTNGKTIRNQFKDLSQIPPTTKESDTMSKVMKKEGFAFVGSTVCYAHMQATGMVNDHLTNCFRYAEV